MAVEPGAVSQASPQSPGAEAPNVYAEGILAGLVGAGTIALWFLVLDTIRGRPFYTPTVLGTALFRGGAALSAPEQVPASLDLVLSFTWVHVLAFLLIGVAAARLIALAERDPDFGFGVVLLFVVFEFAFVLVSLAFAEPILHALAWQAVLVGNLLAAAAMAAVFRVRHPQLTIRP